MSHSFSWTAQGFNLFVELAKLPLTIASLSLPLGTISAVMHRSSQTAKQIDLSLELSRFKDFLEHRNAFIEEVKRLLPESWSSTTVNRVYKVFFPESIKRQYQPNLPDSWVLLYRQINEYSGDLAFNDFFDLGYLAQMETDEDLSKLVESKSEFIKNISKFLDKAVSTIEPVCPELGVFDRNGISDDDDFFLRCSDLVLDCRSMFFMLSTLASALLESNTYQFLSKEQISILMFFSGSEVDFETEPKADFGIFLGCAGQEIIKRVMHEDENGKRKNGDLVALTFRFKLRTEL